jgi:hypothetical protein
METTVTIGVLKDIMQLSGYMNKTCDHCGYDRVHCQCGRKRNTTGDPIKFQNYEDMRSSSDYAMTSRIRRADPQQRKIMEELMPVDEELLLTYIKRTDIATNELCKYGVHQHLFGTKREWSCHTTSRYCFICTMAQFIDTMRGILTMIPQEKLSDLHIQVDNDPESIYPRIQLYTL